MRSATVTLTTRLDAAGAGTTAHQCKRRDRRVVQTFKLRALKLLGFYLPNCPSSERPVRAALLIPRRYCTLFRRDKRATRTVCTGCRPAITDCHDSATLRFPGQRPP